MLRSFPARMDSTQATGDWQRASRSASVTRGCAPSLESTPGTELDHVVHHDALLENDESIGHRLVALDLRDLEPVEAGHALSQRDPARVPRAGEEVLLSIDSLEPRELRGAEGHILGSRTKEDAQ